MEKDYMSLSATEPNPFLSTDLFLRYSGWGDKTSPCLRGLARDVFPLEPLLLLPHLALGHAPWLQVRLRRFHKAFPDATAVAPCGPACYLGACLHRPPHCLATAPTWWSSA